MEDLIKTLYDDFFKRDLLGKIVPGFITIFSIIRTLELNVFKLLPEKEWLWLLWVMAIPTFFMVGVALQIGGELLGLHSASPRPRYIFFNTFLVPSTWKKVNQDFDVRVSVISNASEDKWTKYSKKQRERYVYLKEGSGNFALALLVALICLYIRSPKSSGMILILLTLMTLLFLSHFIHAKRQADFEIMTLQKSGLITKEKANVE